MLPSMLSWWLVVVLFLSNPVLSQEGRTAPTRPTSVKECAICHYKWVDTFFEDGESTELAVYPSGAVVASEAMCFSCHDGSVVDSRARMLRGHGHRTGTPPPDDMAIPEVFPLDDRGNMECATCHTAHNIPVNAADAGETIFLRMSNRNSAMCKECHADKLGGLETGNHPLVRTEVPAWLVDSGAKASSHGNELICETCHSAHGSSS